MEVTLHCISIWTGIQSKSDQNKNWPALIPCSLFWGFLIWIQWQMEANQGFPISASQYTKKEPSAKGGKRFFTMKSYHAQLYKTVAKLTYNNVWMSQEWHLPFQILYLTSLLEITICRNKIPFHIFICK